MTAIMVSSRSARPVSDLPLLQSYAALLVAGAGDQVRVAAALADRDGVGCSCVRRIVVARFEALLDHRQQQVAALSAFAGFVLEEPLGAGKPAGRTTRFIPHVQAKAQPESASGARDLAGVHVGLVGTFKHDEIIVVPAGQV